MAETGDRRLGPEEAHSQAVVVSEGERAAVRTHKREIQRGFIDKMASLKEKEAERLTEFSEDLDRLRKEDESAYNLTLTLYELNRQLEDAVKRSRAEQLKEALGSERERVMSTYLWELRNGAREDYPYDNDVTLGAVERLFQMDIYADVPAEAWRALTEGYRVWSCLTDHLEGRKGCTEEDSP